MDWRNKAEKFPGIFRWRIREFAEKCVGSFPKLRQTQIKNSTQNRLAEPRDQQLGTLNLLISGVHDKPYLEAFIAEEVAHRSFWMACVCVCVRERDKLCV